MKRTILAICVVTACSFSIDLSAQTGTAGTGAPPAPPAGSQPPSWDKDKDSKDSKDSKLVTVIGCVESGGANEFVLANARITSLTGVATGAMTGRPGSSTGTGAATGTSTTGSATGTGTTGTTAGTPVTGTGTTGTATEPMTGAGTMTGMTPAGVSYRLIGEPALNLDQHLGHRIEVTGMLVGDNSMSGTASGSMAGTGVSGGVGGTMATGAAPPTTGTMAAAADVGMPSIKLNVRSVRMIAASCTP